MGAQEESVVVDAILDVLERPDFFELLRQHIFLSAVALLIGIAIALPVRSR